MKFPWPAALRRKPSLTATDRRIEERLLRGEVITLALTDELDVKVDLDGITMTITHEHELPDSEARRLLLSARYAAAFAPPPGRRRDAPTDPNTIPVHLTPEENTRVGDVLAAYFRLNSED